MYKRGVAIVFIFYNILAETWDIPYYVFIFNIFEKFISFLTFQLFVQLFIITCVREKLYQLKGFMCNSKN